jgi:hypothetical protein
MAAVPKDTAHPTWLPPPKAKAPVHTYYRVRVAYRGQWWHGRYYVEDGRVCLSSAYAGTHCRRQQGAEEVQAQLMLLKAVKAWCAQQRSKPAARPARRRPRRAPGD